MRPYQPRLCAALYLGLLVMRSAATEVLPADDAAYAAAREPSTVALVRRYAGPATLAPDAVTQPQGYAWRGPRPSQPDWAGAARDAGYFLGYQAAAIAVLYVLPESISGWSREQKQDYDFDRWRDNVSQPVWDHDDWIVNYVLHPYWGAAYYIRARERGLDRHQSFWYSALLSALWEYGAEALAEPVSIQDLIVTPVFGALVGEYLFTPWRETIRAKPGALEWSDKVVLALTDPLGVINAQLDDWLGVQARVTFDARAPAGRGHPALRGVPPGPGSSGAPAVTWSVRLRVTW